MSSDSCTPKHNKLTSSSHESIQDCSLENTVHKSKSTSRKSYGLEKCKNWLKAKRF